ncbi:DUF3822 family protein [Marinilabilia salmonicolor]|jgi:hypothetical protein|uniref:Uncharacterized protein DUF3822 n=1 Tax=Marinilabilia salmonicolor TaxID=989 RepID=A0A2T0XAP8_9BACT|nr:DUF3822 family protein [Marinilabilia salmonicolor]PRY96018.1 uncharacterized protein DUF3822 [Marinilabilia salmonicolor]RCW29433.1 uncharacterized protein DUF3822 [Marinilabilia salmonicolor]
MIPDLSVVDETYDTTITSSYFLSIQASLDGFSFCTLDPVRNKYVQFRHFAFKNLTPEELPEIAEQIFRDNELLNLPYKKVFILIPSPVSTLVPSGLFQPGEAQKWLSFTHQVPSGSDIAFTNMKMADACTVFTIPEKLKNLFKRQFPEPMFFHQYVPMTETKLAISRPGNSKSQIIINVQNRFFDLVVLEKNNLRLCNTFEINGEDDLIYFTLFVFEQLQISPATAEIQFIGHHPSANKIKQKLGKYLKHVKQPGLPSGFQYSYLFRDVPGHQFYNLFSLAGCV